MDETQDRLLRALSKEEFGDLAEALNSWTEGLSMIEQLDNLQYCVKVVQEKIEPVFKAVLNLRDTSGSIKVEDQVLEALRSVKKNEGLIKAFYRSILHHINSQNDDIYRYKPPKDITLIKEEINGWTRIVCALFRKNNEVLVRGSLDGRDPTDRWDDQGNSLHLASGSDCHQVFQEIVNDIKARSIDNPQLSEKWFSTANKGGRTALSLAISRFNKPTVEVLIKEAKHDLKVCWTSYEKYPIHDLVCDAAELTKSYDYYTEACLDILRAIVQACPESLTQQCKASDSVGTYSGGPPFQMAKDAHEVNPDSKLLAALVNEIEDLCLRHLDGEDRAKALDLSKGPRFLIIHIIKINFSLPASDLDLREELVTRYIG
ncbi:hypothetical protein GQ53DRAFT_359334 [Thozetella sp. PMI_491]|nr:hypothetical protein GQ53DRAFT_359334 [Thozetella sp. PMI_491]